MNLQAWIIARICGWRFDWLFQAIGIPLMIGIGYFARSLANQVMLDGEPGMFTLIGSIGISFVIHLSLVGITIWNLPWLIGFEKDDIEYLIGKIMRVLK